MGLADGTMAKGSDDMNADRMRMLNEKMNDGTITDAEREELAKMQGKTTDSDM
jgi:hypothetical protein